MGAVLLVEQGLKRAQWDSSGTFNFTCLPYHVRMYPVNTHVYVLVIPHSSDRPKAEGGYQLASHLSVVAEFETRQPNRVALSLAYVHMYVCMYVRSSEHPLQMAAPFGLVSFLYK